MSLAVYEAGLRDPDRAVSLRLLDGAATPADLDRWRGPLQPADRTLLARCTGAVLDVGCGPGRFLAAFAAAGRRALGIDLSAVAVDLATARGGRAVVGSIFDSVPDAGCWDTALLVDGNLGIGGDPVRLLRRVREVLAPSGRVLVELSPGLDGARRARLESGEGAVGSWFSWAWVGPGSLAAVAAAAGLSRVEQWSAPDLDGERHFADLRVMTGVRG